MAEGTKLRCLTGVKPTGIPHIGNYLGAIRPALELSKTHESLLFIADLHALTTQKDPKLLEEETYAVAATWLALGLDTKEHVFYKQTDVPEVTTLAWILSCFTPMGMLQRGTSVKDAKEKASGDINHGVFYYPVLMAADILLYDADVVPVGKDQKQHLEVAQEIARKFNHQYGEVLKVPRPDIREEVMTVPGLDGRKMSKSYGNTIELFMDTKPLRKRVMQVKTDSTALGEPLTPKDNTLFELYSLFATPEQRSMLERKFITGRKDPGRSDDSFDGPEDNYYGWGWAKQDLFEIIEETFRAPRDEYRRLMADKGHIRQLLHDGAAKARTIGGPVLRRVMDACGFVP